MNRKYLYILIIFAYTAVNTFADSTKLKILYYDRLPYYGNVNGKVEGVLVDIAKEIFDEAGIQYEFVYTASIRVLENLKTHENSCALGWFKTKEREEIYSYSDDYIYQDKPYTMIINKEKITLKTRKPPIVFSIIRTKVPKNNLTKNLPP